MPVYQIILDTNILVAALRSRRGIANRLLMNLDDARWQVNVSTALVLEYEDVLKRPGMVEGFTAEAIDVLIDGICSIARRHNIFFLWRPLSSDPQDDFLLELAATAHAHFIITYNPRHLRPAEQFGVKLLTPKEFLQLLGDLPV
ncbi:MAG: putative toxin-antitoxin system toxin component, PIN family [Pyrinomonadaceae bacterium MAG19_C2-C3]|nr:putative toxin-antitoxin system toxin component, PIN family [Pyrinomonadaceae bacterium MAG19_C2-C3]